MPTRYKIHPSIGLARLGNSDDFYIGPETLSGLPIDCDGNGNAITLDGKEQTVTHFRDNDGKIKRQAARFRVYMYDDANPDGIELVVADPANNIKGTIVQGFEGGGSGELIGVQWVVWLANKKSAWYEFKELQGEHGYPKKAKVRNRDIKNRQALVIDPGPVFITGPNQSAEMAAGANPGYTQSFPPPLTPASITSLGSVHTDKDNRLLVVGAYGNSGSLLTGLGQPQIDHYANNEGWFDDIADGPVTCVLTYQSTVDQAPEPIAITDPAWCIVGYPRFAPQIPDMVTLDDLLYNLSVRQFAYAPYLYGPAGFGPPGFDPEELGTDKAADDALAAWRRQPKSYNENYYPYWDTDIYPILSRPYLYQSFTTVIIQDDPHETAPGGNFDMTVINKPPAQPNDPANDPGWGPRNLLFSVLRMPGDENDYAVTLPMPPPMQPLIQPLMPLLNGDNALSNEIVSKFFTLTETQLFMLKQWACGKFIAGNEPTNDPSQIIGPPPPPIGTQIDRGVMANGLGGAFCPGGEVTWIIRNPQIFIKPYRIHQAPWKVNINDTRQLNLQAYKDPELNATTKEKTGKGFEAGDMTKRNAVPWQSDFNECTTNKTDVRYRDWNVTSEPIVSPRDIIWWPAHRPLQVPTGPNGPFVQWANGISQTLAGDLKMVTAWKSLGFLRNVSTAPVTTPQFVLQETNDKEL
jgi:hypothetical protein